MKTKMEADIFNEFISEDGSTELGRNVVIQSCNENDSSTSSPYFSVNQVAIAAKRAKRINNDLYREKYRKLKKVAKGFVFENAALCDEVSRLQEKMLIAKEERRFLLRKLLSYQSVKDGSAQNNPVIPVSVASQANKTIQMESTDSPVKKKNPVKKKPAQKSTEENAKPRPKKKKIPTDRRLVMPIPLDSAGRPIFPIDLGSLTIHSLGVIVPDKPGFHTEQCIFPIGFCSSRTYLSLKNPNSQCLYQCTVTDGSFGPRFEIMPEDSPGHSLVANSPNEVHSALLKAINVMFGKEMVSTEGQGVKFFGLSHPTVQNLIQSCPGARKCLDYRWVHFEVAKATDNEEDQMVKDYDPTINYEVLLHMIADSAQQTKIS